MSTTTPLDSDKKEDQEKKIDFDALSAARRLRGASVPTKPMDIPTSKPPLPTRPRPGSMQASTPVSPDSGISTPALEVSSTQAKSVEASSTPSGSPGFLGKLLQKIKKPKSDLEKGLKAKLHSMFLATGYYQIYSKDAEISHFGSDLGCPSMVVFNHSKHQSTRLYPTTVKLPTSSNLPEAVSRASGNSGNISFVIQTAENDDSLHPEYALFSSDDLKKIKEDSSTNIGCSIEVFTFNPKLTISGTKKVTVLNDKESKASADERASDEKASVEVSCFKHQNKLYPRTTSAIINGITPEGDHLFTVVTPNDGRPAIVTYHWILSKTDYEQILDLNAAFAQEKDINLEKYLQTLLSVKMEEEVTEASLANPYIMLKTMLTPPAVLPSKEPVRQRSLSAESYSSASRKFRAKHPALFEEYRATASIEALSLEEVKGQAEKLGTVPTKHHRAKTEFHVAEIGVDGKNGETRKIKRSDILEGFVSRMKSLPVETARTSNAISSIDDTTSVSGSVVSAGAGIGSEKRSELREMLMRSNAARQAAEKNNALKGADSSAGESFIAPATRTRSATAPADNRRVEAAPVTRIKFQETVKALGKGLDDILRKRQAIIAQSKSTVSAAGSAAGAAGSAAGSPAPSKMVSFSQLPKALPKVPGAQNSSSVKPSNSSPAKKA